MILRYSFYLTEKKLLWRYLSKRVSPKLMYSFIIITHTKKTKGSVKQLNPKLSNALLPYFYSSGSYQQYCGPY